MTELERTLTGLRTCAGTVLGAASVAGSFLGARASHGSLNTWVILAIVAFVLCMVCAVWVLLPHELGIAAGGTELLAVSDDCDMRDMAEAYRTAGGWLEPQLQSNRRMVARLSNWLTIGCMLLAIEIALWTLSLVG